jgi:hypothetical protein
MAGRRSVLAVVVDAAMARAVLAPLGLPCTLSTFAPARDPPQAEPGSTTLGSLHDRRRAPLGRVCADVAPTYAHVHGWHPVAITGSLVTPRRPPEHARNPD